MSRIALSGFAVLIIGMAPVLQGGDMVKAKDGSGVFGYKDTPKLPGCDYVMHDPDRPLPPRVQVGPPGPPVPPPSDAVILFDGQDLSAWQPSNWKIEDGQIVAGEGKLVSKTSFGDLQVHAEWMAPTDFKGPWYGSGNNGVTLMDQFEVQIFDSANTDIKLYADGECGAIYGQTPPLVNVCRKAGEWQSLDIFFTAPVFEQGKLVKPARVTALQNDILIHLNQEIYGETRHRVSPAYTKTNSVGPISLPAHYCPVRLRNIWVRPLKQERDKYVSALTQTDNPARAFSVGRRLLAADSFVQEATEQQRIEQALPVKAKLSAAARAQEKLGWRLGIEAYTFHKFTFFETIDKTAALGLPYIGGLSFMQKVSGDIPKNFDQHLSEDELRQIRHKLESAGVRLLTYYAQTIPNDEAGCRKLFEFGRKMGFETFMCEPKSGQLDLLDKLANEYGLNVAIHNHGPNISPDNWRPEQILTLCEGRSKRIGAAPDLGYWLRNGVDPVEAVRLLKERVITVQMHDLHAAGGQGHDVPWGTGIGKSEAFFRELHRQGIKPTMIGLEYSHNWLESVPEIARCIEFFNATTLKLASESTTQGTP